VSEISHASPRSLSPLATAIRREHEAAEASWRDAVAHAVRAGELLIEAKAKLSHGEWLPWLERNFPASVRTAQGYMRLARRAEDAQALAHLGVEGALRELARPREREGLPTTKGQAHAFTENAAGWLVEATEAMLAKEPLPPIPPLPEDTDDHLEMARFWLACGERAKVAVHRAGRRALAIAAAVEGPAAAAYARMGAVALELAEAEPWPLGEDHEELIDEWYAALDGLLPLPETENEVVAAILAELARLAREKEPAA
jgi:hypothetical protein